MVETGNAERAFKWITALLKSSEIPFRVAGGLAARAYGSKRPLADIDLDVPEKDLTTLGARLKEYTKFGPARYLDGSWDLLLLSVTYEGQEIDLAGAHNAKIFDSIRKKWVTLKTDFANSPVSEVLGQQVLVIPRDELIAYKKILRREVDLLDVQALETLER